LVELLQKQAKQIQSIMASIQDFQDQLNRIGAATDNIAADLVRLADQIANGGLSAADETAIVESLRAAAEKLEGVAAINPEPIEPPIEG
jgi:archaellum component FlaC